MKRTSVLVLVGVLTMAACSQPAAPAPLPSPDQSVVPEGPATTVNEPPVDSTLMPVSLSKASEEASTALHLCVTEGQEKLVGGMAQVPSAQDVPRYGWFYGSPPELETDAPAWVVQYQGDMASRLGTLHDPTCVVIDGRRTIFATGGYTNPQGVLRERSKLAIPPQLALPPLEP